MLIPAKKEFGLGLILTILFFGLLFYMFTPSFHGVNAFHASDDLFNSRAKDHSYFIPELRETNKKYLGKYVDLSIELPKVKDQALIILNKTGVQAQSSNEVLNVQGDLGKMISAALDDSKSMYYNEAEQVSSKYGLPAQEVLYTWEMIFKQAKKDLTNQKKFKEAKFLSQVMFKGVEVAYNFYGIKAEGRSGVLVFALIFYVAYTLLWGFAIYFLFEGFGLAMSAGKKKEV